MILPRKYYLKDGSIYWHRLYFDIVPRWMAKYSPPLGHYNYAAYLYQPQHYIRDIYDECKYFIQRGYRGWSDRDAWSIDYFLDSIMPAMLRRLKKMTHGVPYSLTVKQWHAKLDRIIRAFETAKRIKDYGYKDKADIIKANKQFHEDFNVFRRYYFSLWD